MKQRKTFTLKFLSVVIIVFLAALFITCPEDTPVSGDILNKTILDLTGGSSEKLTASVPVLSWVSSNEKIATVSSDGTVKAVHSGMARITAALEGGKFETCIVWVNRIGEDVQEVGVYPILSPKAGNYPQGLFKYPFRYGDKLASHLPQAMEAFRQDLSWDPVVTKTFDRDTKYTATLKLTAPTSRYFDDGPTGPPINVSRLPQDGVESIFIDKIGIDLVITIYFEKTASVNALREIIFGDEFNGTELDLTKWGEPLAQIRTDGTNRWEPDIGLATVSDGVLRLRYLTDPENDPAVSGVSQRILGGAVQSKRRDRSITFDRSYGYFEASIKFPRVPGAWGAFWLMSDTTDFKEDGGIDGTEIDIVETPYAYPRQFNAALHWDGYQWPPANPGQPRNCHLHWDESDIFYSELDIYNNFNTFAVCWSPSAYVFYVNNQEFWRVDLDENKMVRQTDEQLFDFSQTALGINQNPSYIILSVEAMLWAGALADNIDEVMEVDWVRVWNQPPASN